MAVVTPLLSGHDDLRISRRASLLLTKSHGNRRRAKA